MGKKLHSWMKAEWVARFRAQEAERRRNGEITKDDWNALLHIFDYKCAYCRLMGDLTYDHFIPKSAGGGLTKDNIVPACGSCNRAKSNIPPEVWLSKTDYDRVCSLLSQVSELPA